MPGGAATTGSGGGKAADKHRDLLEERQRIDAAIATIDAAKRKALSQREEYGKFLRWKVKMQHKERAQREEEERQLRDRIDARLKSVLEEHRLRKQDEVERWRAFSANAAPRMRESSGALAARLQQEAVEHEKAEERQRKRELIAARLRATPQAATDGSSPTKGKKSSSATARHGYEPQVPRRGGPPAVARGAGGRGDGGDGGATPAEEGVMFPTEQAFRAAFPLPDAAPLSKGTGVPIPGAMGGMGTLTAEQAKEIEQIDQNRKRVARNERLIRDMYESAKSRKLYSTARMLADPPADFMIGADLMRYIPADVMDGIDEATAPKPQPSQRADAQTFFITENQQEGGGAMLAPSSDLADPAEERHTDQQASGDARKANVRGAPRPGGSRVSRWKAYDPHAWMNEQVGANADVMAEGVATLADATRNKTEERATLDWYHECYEPLTRIKKRTERHKTHSWTGVGTHKLPPLASAKFRD